MRASDYDLFDKQVFEKVCLLHVFFNNFNYSNLKKILKNFKLYTSKYPKIYTLQKNFLTTFTGNYCNKILDKHPKNSFAKQDLSFQTVGKI